LHLWLFAWRKKARHKKANGKASLTGSTFPSLGFIDLSTALTWRFASSLYALISACESGPVYVSRMAFRSVAELEVLFASRYVQSTS
jgi:hypothetical protein